MTQDIVSCVVRHRSPILAKIWSWRLYRGTVECLVWYGFCLMLLRDILHLLITYSDYFLQFSLALLSQIIQTLSTKPVEINPLNSSRC